MKADFTKLYTLSNAFTRGALHVTTTCEFDDCLLMRGEWVPDHAIPFTHLRGGKPRDLIGTTYPGVYLISDRIVACLYDQGFNGWATYPVTVCGQGGQAIEGYHGFAITGRCGPPDWSKSRRERRPPPVPEGQPYDVRVGLHFAPDSWDGSDVFTPEGTLHRLVTEEVMRALTSVKATNVEFTRLSEYEATI